MENRPDKDYGTGDLFDEKNTISDEEIEKLLKAQKKKAPTVSKKRVKMDHSLQTSMFESKFRSFLESIQTEDNKNLVENITKAFDIIYSKT